MFYKNRINSSRKILFIISIAILCLLTIYVQRGNTQIMAGYPPFAVTAPPFFTTATFPPFPVTAPPLYTAARNAAVLGGTTLTTTLALLAAITPTAPTTPTFFPTLATTPTFFPTVPTTPTVTPTIGAATLLLLGGGGTSTTTLLALGI